MLKQISIVAFAAILSAAAGCADNKNMAGHGGTHAHGSISKEDVQAAQRAWGEGIVDISRVYAEGGDYEARAVKHIDSMYAYGDTIVLFKPTLARDDQFRGTFDEALSYFIGRKGTEDTGFAIQGWTNVRFENEGIYTDSDSAMAMGNYFFKDPNGDETKVEYSFGYVRDDAGDVKIMLQHSSVPFGSWKD